MIERDSDPSKQVSGKSAAVALFWATMERFETACLSAILIFAGVVALYLMPGFTGNPNEPARTVIGFGMESAGFLMFSLHAQACHARNELLATRYLAIFTFFCMIQEALSA